jgi:D-alanyl-D-alanine-carboxypeptidase/D-alanyl-D-alanine-endopeptidase
MIRKMPILTLAVLAPLVAQPQPESPVPPDSEIRKILADRIDAQKQGVGIVIGVIEPKGRRIVSYGKLDQGDPRPLNGDTVFEIGSVTKVFTSLLLSAMAGRGEVSLSDPISKYLPADVKTPQRDGKQIALQDLASHTSGLPRIPGNMTGKDPANPYADYSSDLLYRFLSSYTLPRDIGAQYEYSNLGGGLLGFLLSRRAGVDYEELVRTRISAPLQMTSTAIVLSPELKARLAPGHDQALEKVPNWDFAVLAGCGALRSTANDMLNFVAANLGYTTSPLAPAMAAMWKNPRATGAPGMEIALGWHLFKRERGNDIIWHNGGTGGYRSFIGFDPKARIGVVALSNTSTAVGVDDIGRHLLDSHAPLQEPPKPHKEITVDPARFDAYVGRYQLTPAFIITITREANHFFAQASNQPKFEVFPETERDYFLKVVDAQIAFEVDSQGHATALVLHQAGRDQRATRME